MRQRKTSRSPVTKPLFYAIGRNIRLARSHRNYNARTIAAQHGVSAETVRAVRRAGTWPQFVRDKEARRTRALQRTYAQVVSKLPDNVARTITAGEWGHLHHRIRALEKWQHDTEWKTTYQEARRRRGLLGWLRGRPQ